MRRGMWFFGAKTARTSDATHAGVGPIRFKAVALEAWDRVALHKLVPGLRLFLPDPEIALVSKRPEGIRRSGWLSKPSGRCLVEEEPSPESPPNGHPTAGTRSPLLNPLHPRYHGQGTRISRSSRWYNRVCSVGSTSWNGPLQGPAR